MKKVSMMLGTAFLCISALQFYSCQQPAEQKKTETITVTEKVVDNAKFAGFESQVQWGEHLVKVGGCHDCHTPKKFGPKGMEVDYSRALSGHPSDLPAPDVNRSEMEKKGLIVTNDLTTWVGPWGVSFAANLTPDPTGTKSWKEEQFIYALRNGIYKGLPGSRPLLPPMPWDMYKNMSDDELKAIFAYLQSIPPINNAVPPPIPPASAKKG